MPPSYGESAPMRKDDTMLAVIIAVLIEILLGVK